MSNQLGPTQDGEAINFSLYSEQASKVTLGLFDKDRMLKKEFPLKKTGSVWHIAINDVPEDALYAYRVDDKPDWLVDPYAKALYSEGHWGEKPSPLLCRIQRPSDFNWGGDAPLHLPFASLLIYEMHIRGFTKDASSQVKYPGTFLGLIEKIPHLQALGINCVELLPIYLFDESSGNYWGYSPLHFFAPMTRFASNPERASEECKEMVKAFHKAGIEVVLDVVFNHTGSCPSFRRLDNQIYYLLNENGEDMNFSGCGNTVQCNHPVVIELIVSALRHWVTEYHIDGFRFDLASIFCRGANGEVLENSPLIEAICNDPVLAKTKLIAEPWDCGGLYQVGSFPRADRFAQWNGQYRDQVRRFLKGTDGQAGGFAKVLADSSFQSINFVTAHDGFTLCDLVSYNEKHNEANGEENRDGNNANESWNCGEEGPSTSPEVLSLRERQMRNFVCALLLGAGTPMILMGDEYGHTREGNNNAYCQDNRLNYFLWDELEARGDFFRFYQKMIDFRKGTLCPLRKK